MTEKKSGKSRRYDAGLPVLKARRLRRKPEVVRKDKADGSEYPEKREFRSVPWALRFAIEGELAAFNIQLLMTKELCFCSRFRGRYLYLFFETPKGFEPFCRLEFTGDPNGWNFAAFQSRSKRYEPPVDGFVGAHLLDGTVEGALRAGVAAYSAQKSALKQGSPSRSARKKRPTAASNLQEPVSAYQDYDTSWEGGNKRVWDEKFKQWQKRDWLQWLDSQLSFPFDVERTEDGGRAFFSEEARQRPFGLGHIMTALGMVDEDDLYGVIVKVREGRKIGYVPLADTEVVSRDDKNFGHVREYTVWFANR